MEIAIGILEEGLFLNPDNPVLHTQIGYYLIHYDLEKAIRHFEKALEINEDYSLALSNLGQLNFYYGDYANSIKELESSRRVDSGYCGSAPELNACWRLVNIIILGDAYRLTGKERESVRLHKEGEKLFNSSDIDRENFLGQSWTMLYYSNKKPIILSSDEQKRALLYFSITLDYVYLGDDNKTKKYIYKLLDMHESLILREYFIDAAIILRLDSIVHRTRSRAAIGSYIVHAPKLFVQP